MNIKNKRSILSNIDLAEPVVCQADRIEAEIATTRNWHIEIPVFDHRRRELPDRTGLRFNFVNVAARVRYSISIMVNRHWQIALSMSVAV